MPDRPADYSKMTDEDFDDHLDRILLHTSISTIRTIGNVEAEIREEFNNAVLESWAAANPELAYPETNEDK